MGVTSSRLDRIFGSLESAGFPRALQKSLLPEWVTSDVLADDAASFEVAAILAKRLGLRTSPLLQGEEPRQSTSGRFRASRRTSWRQRRSRPLSPRLWQRL